MGIRPENLYDKVSEFPEATAKAKVEVVELMGSETYLYLSVEGSDTNTIARVDSIV